MAFDETLAHRVRSTGRRHQFSEKAMFGGLAFFLNDHLCVGLLKNAFILRLSPEAGEEALARDAVQEFRPTGKPMRGWVTLDASSTNDESLTEWVNLAVSFVRTLPPKAESTSKTGRAAAGVKKSATKQASTKTTVQATAKRATGKSVRKRPSH